MKATLLWTEEGLAEDGADKINLWGEHVWVYSEAGESLPACGEDTRSGFKGTVNTGEWNAQ